MGDVTLTDACIDDFPTKRYFHLKRLCITCAGVHCTLHRRHLTVCHVHDPPPHHHPTLELELSAMHLNAACLSNVHINHSTAIRQPRTRSPRLTRPESRERGCTDTEPPCLSPCLVHTSCPPARQAGKQAAAAVSATHRPDVAVRSRPQLARSVLLRIHPPAGGRGSYYISHATCIRDK